MILTVTSDSDKVDCPSCHSVEVGKEKVNNAFEMGSSGIFVSEKISEKFSGDHGVTECHIQEIGFFMKRNPVEIKVSTPLDKVGTTKII
jgi:hypothetical protein